MKTVGVIMKNGKTVDYDREILFDSLVSACLSVRASDGEAKMAAERVTSQVEKWLKNKDEVTSEDIRQTAAKHLKTYHPEAAYMYRQVRVMI